MAKFLSFILFIICLLNAFLVILGSSVSNYTYVCDPSRFAELELQMSSFAFCDSSLPYAARVKDLVGRMTLEEKVKQLGPVAAGVPRLGLLSHNWGSEALHGLSNFSATTVFDSVVPSATMFPTVILTTASFNESLWKKIGQVIILLLLTKENITLKRYTIIL